MTDQLILTNPDEMSAADYIDALGRRARLASRALASAPRAAKDLALHEAAKALRAASADIIAANALDIDEVKDKADASFIDRLRLDEARLEAMARALEEIADLPDPVGRILAEFDRPNGLKIERVAVPIGVIGMIYESRPNVGADASALCLKSGNAVILRGGSESRNSSREIVKAMRAGLAAAGLPEDAVQMVETADRAAVTALLQALEHVDLVIPRGGRGLVELVRDSAAVPTLLHLDGNCHTYVHEAADLGRALDVIENAKLRRTGVCGATESIVIDRAVAAEFLPMLTARIGERCELRGDAEALAICPSLSSANEDDWGQEYLAPVASVKIVSGLDEGIAHVAAHSSAHTDAILTEDAAAAARFMAEIDSAIVMHNASTQFADGGEFGMGAEIGIATGKMHARGPVGLEQLCSFKYKVHGSGQVRG